MVSFISSAIVPIKPFMYIECNIFVDYCQIHIYFNDVIEKLHIEIVVTFRTLDHINAKMN